MMLCEGGETVHRAGLPGLPGGRDATLYSGDKIDKKDLSTGR